jgi:O-acetyl-ADP-ribose deacetylase (regulator of RNase III)
MFKIITGNLLQSTEKYIVHQTNCVTTGQAAGIAKAIFDKYPYSNCYYDRIKPSKPGTIDIRGDGANQRFVINLHGQIFPGCGLNSNLDNLKARQKYFYHCLLRIAKISNLESIAFNYKIGCGMAGGNWDYYSKVLENFSIYVKHTQNAQTYLYRRKEDG